MVFVQQFGTVALSKVWVNGADNVAHAVVTETGPHQVLLSELLHTDLIQTLYVVAGASPLMVIEVAVLVPDAVVAAVGAVVLVE